MERSFIADEHFQTIFNHLQDGIFITDQRGVAIWANDMSTIQLGVSRDEIIGKHVEEMEEKGLFTPSVTKIVLKQQEITTKVQTSLGRQYLATGHYVKIPYENSDYVIVQVKDITETVKASFQLEKAESLLEEYVEEINRLKQHQKKEKMKKFIIGNSREHEKMVNLMERVAPVDTTILLSGETGVGKSIIAKEIHTLSNRPEEPFIQVNCGAIPETLLESELFGYEKGAFTGANQKGKEGLAQKADGGTLFLDEIGELPLPLQPKILQLVQNKSFIPIGSTVTKTVDIRIITATNQNLLEMVEERSFRSDLYYRLNVVTIHIPALRERKGDIPAFVYYFFEWFKNKYNIKLTIDKDVVEILQQYSWPGNVRELENLMEFLVVTSATSNITTKGLPATILEHRQLNISLSEKDKIAEKTLPAYLEEIERTFIKEAKANFKTTREAAQSLGMTQSSYMRRLQKYNLEKGNN